MSGGTIFVGPASEYILVANQVTLQALDTITSKRKFKQMVSNGRVKIAQYRADNGTFSSRAFEDEIEQMNQAILFSRVRALYQECGTRNYNGC